MQVQTGHRKLEQAEGGGQVGSRSDQPSAPSAAPRRVRAGAAVPVLARFVPAAIDDAPSPSGASPRRLLPSPSSAPFLSRPRPDRLLLSRFPLLFLRPLTEHYAHRSTAQVLPAHCHMRCTNSPRRLYITHYASAQLMRSPPIYASIPPGLLVATEMIVGASQMP